MTRRLRIIPPMMTGELRRYRRFKAWSGFSLGLAILFALATIGAWLGGGWVRVTWVTAVLVIVFGLASVMYYTRAGDIEAEALSRSVVDVPRSLHIPTPPATDPRRFAKPGEGQHSIDTGGQTTRIVPPSPRAGRAEAPTSEDVQ